MASTLYRAATIAASGGLDKKIHIYLKAQKIRASPLTMSSSCPFLLPVLLATLRLWNLESKTCVQEITAHRKKFDESIFDVAFHPSRPYIARYCQVLQFSPTTISIQPCFPQCWRRCSCKSVHLKIQDSQDLPLKTIKISIMTLYRFKSSSASSCILSFKRCAKFGSDLFQIYGQHLLKLIPYTLNVKFMW